MFEVIEQLHNACNININPVYNIEKKYYRAGEKNNQKMKLFVRLESVFASIERKYKYWYHLALSAVGIDTMRYLSIDAV